MCCACQQLVSALREAPVENSGSGGHLALHRVLKSTAYSAKQKLCVKQIFKGKPKAEHKTIKKIAKIKHTLMAANVQAKRSLATSLFVKNQRYQALHGKTASVGRRWSGGRKKRATASWLRLEPSASNGDSEVNPGASAGSC
jgi:hypothetical protein